MTHSSPTAFVMSADRNGLACCSQRLLILCDVMDGLTIDFLYHIPTLEPGGSRRAGGINGLHHNAASSGSQLQLLHGVWSQLLYIDAI